MSNSTITFTVHFDYQKNLYSSLFQTIKEEKLKVNQLIRIRLQCSIEDY